MLRFLIPFILFTMAALYAQDEPAKVQLVASKVMQRTEKAIIQAKKTEKEQVAFLIRLKKGTLDRNVKGLTFEPNSNRPVKFQNKAQKDEEIARAEAKLSQLKAKLKRYASGEEYEYGSLLDGRSPKLGDFGKFLVPVNVRQVIDKNSMLVRSSYSYEVLKVFGSPSNGGQVVIPTFESQEVILMVKDTPTKGAVDNGPFELEQVFQLTDTETYNTSGGGSNTVFVATPLNTKKVEEFLKK